MPITRKFCFATAVFMAAMVVPGVTGAAPSLPPGPPDSYIVVLKDGVDSGQVASEHARGLGAEVRHVYRAALNGYAARVPVARLADLRGDPRVAYVEADGQRRRRRRRFRGASTASMPT